MQRRKNKGTRENEIENKLKLSKVSVSRTRQLRARHEAWDTVSDHTSPHHLILLPTSISRGYYVFNNHFPCRFWRIRMPNTSKKMTHAPENGYC